MKGGDVFNPPFLDSANNNNNIYTAPHQQQQQQQQEPTYYGGEYLDSDSQPRLNAAAAVNGGAAVNGAAVVNAVIVGRGPSSLAGATEDERVLATKQKQV